MRLAGGAASSSPDPARVPAGQGASRKDSDSAQGKSMG
jgi:hypothetical protein